MKQPADSFKVKIYVTATFSLGSFFDLSRSSGELGTTDAADAPDSSLRAPRGWPRLTDRGRVSRRENPAKQVAGVNKTTLLTPCLSNPQNI